jgi:hypothetical protein
MESRLVRLIGLFGLIAVLACGGDPRSPEEQIRDVIASLERSLEEGDVSAFKNFVAEHYEDHLGHDKRSLAAYVTFHVMRNANRHVITRVRSIDIREPDLAAVVIVAGITGTDVSAPEHLVGLHADVYKIDLDLEDAGDGDWRLVWAQWRRAPATDLL